MKQKGIQKDFSRNIENCSLASVTSVTGQIDRKCNKRNKHNNKNDLAVTISLDNTFPSSLLLKKLTCHGVKRKIFCINSL